MVTQVGWEIGAFRLPPMRYAGGMSRWPLAFVVVAILLGFACKRSKPGDPSVAEVADAGDDEVRPVYGSSEPTPLARRLCGALHELPSARRAECCGGTAAASLLATECIRVVSAALKSGAVSLDEVTVDRCEAAQARAFAGCSWVGRWLTPLPSECDSLFMGRSKAGEVCRSSLECAVGTYCVGIGPTDTGRCGPPKSDGQACRTAVDPLVVYARQSAGKQHPECAGYCGHRRCMANAAAGAACTIAEECPSGQHCDGAKCVAGSLAEAGERCVANACAGGLRCSGGVCNAPKGEGEACKDDAECRGGCIPATHKCGMRCDAF